STSILAFEVREVEAQIDELKRELRMRNWVYSKKVQEGQLDKKTARRRYDLMKGAIRSLERYRDSIATPTLFTPTHRDDA
ncbi:MAG: hypothetical protein AAFV01_04250, partial [Bacteroidota bacterium]